MCKKETTKTLYNLVLKKMIIQFQPIFGFLRTRANISTQNLVKIKLYKQLLTVARLAKIITIRDFFNQVSRYNKLSYKRDFYFSVCSSSRKKTTKPI